MKRTLKTKRTVVMKIYVSKKTNARYLKTRDVAIVLGIKQPFEFVHDLKNRFGNKAIKTRRDIPDILPADDSLRATYISVLDLYRYLTCGSDWKFKMDMKKKQELARELHELLGL